MNLSYVYSYLYFKRYAVTYLQWIFDEARSVENPTDLAIDSSAARSPA